MTLRRLLGLVYTSSEYATVITCCEWGVERGSAKVLLGALARRALKPRARGLAKGFYDEGVVFYHLILYGKGLIQS
jgi:hypothetical protein